MRSTEHLPTGTPSAWSLRSRHSSRQRSGASDRGRSTKYMRFFLIILLTATAATAGNKLGSGNNPFGLNSLDDTIALSFFTKPADENLYFRLSWKESETSSSSLSSGSGVSPNERYAYFWDDARKIFWFADERFLQKYDMSKAKEGSTTSRKSMIGDFKADKDFPPEMIPLIESLIQKE